MVHTIPHGSFVVAPYFFSVSVASVGSTGCLQSEAVNKGFVEAARQRDVTIRACAVHQQLSCSPVDTTSRVGAYGGRQ